MTTPDQPDQPDQPVITSRDDLADRLAQLFFDNANTGQNAANDDLITNLRTALNEAVTRTHPG